jgi:hypothetical protein
MSFHVFYAQQFVYFAAICQILDPIEGLTLTDLDVFTLSVSILVRKLATFLIYQT